MDSRGRSRVARTVSQGHISTISRQSAHGPIAVARRLPIYIGSAWTPKPHAYTATILRNELDTGFFQLFLNACERLFA